MTRRHYGLRATKPRDTYIGPVRTGAWSGIVFIGSIVGIMIVLGLILYEVSKTVTDTATSTPRTTSEGRGTQQ